MAAPKFAECPTLEAALGRISGFVRNFSDRMSRVYLGTRRSGYWRRRPRHIRHVQGETPAHILESLQAFNDVRNGQSLAHENEVLRAHHPLYRFNHIARLVRSLQAVEGTIPAVTIDEF
jgi:hypothetical protein